MKWAAVLALLAGGAGSASLATKILAPGQCVRVKHERVCAAPAASQAVIKVVTNTVTQVVTNTQTVTQAAPDPLATAEQEIDHEVAGGEMNDPALPAGEITGLDAMAYVSTNISFFARTYDIANGIPVPGETSGVPGSAVNIFSSRAGECGQHAVAFAALMRHFGYLVRGVQFFYADPNGTADGHIADEVYYDGGWHYFDPSFDQYWTDPITGNVLPISEVRTTGGTEHKGDEQLVNVVFDQKFGGDDTWFTTDPTTTVVLMSPTSSWP